MLSEGIIPVIDQSNKSYIGFYDDSSKKFKDFPVICFGDHTTNIKILKNEFVIGCDGIKILKPKNNEDSIDFLYFNLLCNNIPQEGYKRHYSILKDVKIGLTSKEEQEKIANFLLLIDKKISLLEKKYEYYLKYKKYVTDNIFSQNIKFDGFGEEWKEYKFEDFLSESHIPTEDTLNNRLTVKLNLKGVHARETNAMEKKGGKPRYLRKSGQFIYGAQNLFKGSLGIIPESLDGYISSKDLPSFDFKGNIINPMFFYYFMSREDYYKRLERYSIGSTQKYVYPYIFLKLKMNIPSMNEQEKIINFIEKIENNVKQLEIDKQYFYNYKKYLLQNMFV